MSKINIFELENEIINYDSILEKESIPAECMRVYFDGVNNGVPTAIGWHVEAGWFVLETTGQGPYITYTEKNVEIEKG